MPVVLKKKPPGASPHGHVQSAGKQEDFFAAGVELASKLGWSGDDPSMLGNDIAVEDARAFLIKSLHECFIAGAKGEAQPGHVLACEHLALSDSADFDAIAAAFSAAFEAGKDAPITLHAVSHGVIGAALLLPISTAAEAAQAAGKTV
jgi:hypothetical protein